jgi:hypothetical protein
VLYRHSGCVRDCVIVLLVYPACPSELQPLVCLCPGGVSTPADVLNTTGVPVLQAVKCVVRSIIVWIESLCVCKQGSKVLCRLVCVQNGRGCKQGLASV